MKFSGFLALAAVALVIAPAFAQDRATSDGPVARGSVLAQARCARCHAVGPRGASPYSPAPPFRTLHEKYDVEGLAEAFAEGIVVAHQGARPMPQFVLEPADIDDLIAYLKSLETAPASR